MPAKIESDDLPHLGVAGSPATAPDVDIAPTLDATVRPSFVPFAALPPPVASLPQAPPPAAGAFAISPAALPAVEVPASLDLASAALPPIVSWSNSTLSRPGLGSAHGPAGATLPPHPPHHHQERS